MESLQRAFLEDPLYVYITLGFVALVLAVIWHETRNHRVLVALAVPVVLAGIVWAVSSAIVTDREQIIGASRQIARDIEAGKLTAAEQYLDDDYRGLGTTKTGALAVARATLGVYHVTKVAFTRLEVEVHGPNAAMHAATIVHIEGAGQVALAWDVRWIKRPAGWRILEVDEPQTRLEL